MQDLLIYIAVIAAISLRVYLMRGNFVLPTFYKLGNEVSFNLGSLGSIIIGLLAALILMQQQPDLFSNWVVAAGTAYSAPQIVDAVITKGTRLKYGSETSEDIESDDEVVEDGGA